MAVTDAKLDEKKAAEYVGMSIGFLQRDRCEGATGGRTPGPPFYRVGRRIFYKQSDLDVWLELHRVERPLPNAI